MIDGKGYYRAAWDGKFTASYDSVIFTPHVDAITVVVKAKVSESSQHVMTVDTTSIDHVLTLSSLLWFDATHNDSMTWPSVKLVLDVIKDRSLWQLGNVRTTLMELLATKKCQ